MTELNNEELICMYVAEYLSWQTTTKIPLMRYIVKSMHPYLLFLSISLCHMLANCNFLYKDT